MQVSLFRHRLVFGKTENQEFSDQEPSRHIASSQAALPLDQNKSEPNKPAQKPLSFPAFLMILATLFPGATSAADFWKTPSATKTMAGKTMINFMTEQSVENVEGRKHLLRSFTGLGDLIPGIESNSTLILGIPVMEDPLKAGWLAGIKTIFTPFKETRENFNLTLTPLFMKPPMGDKVNMNIFALIGDKIGPFDTRIDGGINYARVHGMKMQMPTGMGGQNASASPSSMMGMGGAMVPSMIGGMKVTESLSPVLSVEQPLVGMMDQCVARAEFNFKSAEKGGYSIFGGRCQLPKNHIVDAVSAGFDTKSNGVFVFFNKMF